VNIALVIIFATIGISAAVGIIAGRRLKMNLENWTVAGRRFGLLLIWLLMAGEIYTTFTFLGASGWAFSKGAPAFYIFFFHPPRALEGGQTLRPPHAARLFHQTI
jgi:SSS family solute:Na+ symporter